MITILKHPSKVASQNEEHFAKFQQLGREYRLHFQALKETYQDEYYVATVKRYQTPELNQVTTATWTNFIASVFPICELIMLINLDEPGTLHMINQAKMLSLLGDKAVRKESPAPHIVVEEIDDDHLIEQIVSSARKLQSQADVQKLNIF